MNFTKENFELIAMTIKNGKCLPKYNYKHSDTAEKETREYIVKVPVAPHPDLQGLFLQLREYVAKDHYMETDIDTLERIEITQVLTAGKDENKGIKILGTLTTLHDTNVPIQTGLIRFEEDISGFEGDLETIFEAIENEAFLYIFKNKSAQPNLFEVQDVEVIGSGFPQMSKVV